MGADLLNIIYAFGYWLQDQNKRLGKEAVDRLNNTEKTKEILDMKNLRRLKIKNLRDWIKGWENKQIRDTDKIENQRRQKKWTRNLGN